MSEGLFLSLFVFSLLSLIGYFEKGSISLLLISALLCGFAFLTRYIGISLAISGVILILLLSKNSIRLRIRNSLLYLLLSSAPIVFWMIWLRFRSTSPRTTSFQIEGLWNQLEPVRGAFIDFFWSLFPFFDTSLSISYLTRVGFLAVIGVTVLAVVGTYIYRNLRNREQSWNLEPGYLLAIVFSTFGAVYLGSLTLSYLMTDPAPDLSGRILSPVYVSSIMAIFSCLFTYLDTPMRSVAIRGIPIALALLSIFSNLRTSIHVVRSLHLRGDGYTSSSWKASGTLEAMRAIPADTPIITNESDAILFHLNLPSYDLPELFLENPRENLRSFGSDETDHLEELFREQGAALVLFNTLQWQLKPIYQDRTEERIQSLIQDLDVYQESYDGGIYFYPHQD